MIKACSCLSGSQSLWFKPILVSLPLFFFTHFFFLSFKEEEEEKKKRNEKKKLELFLEYTMTSCRHEVPTCTWSGRATRKMAFAAWVVFAT